MPFAPNVALSEHAFDPRFSRPEILFFGIGAQKSGTSWLHHYLRTHGDVCVPRGKELHYWNHIGASADARIASLTTAVLAARKRVRKASQAADALKADAPDAPDAGDAGDDVRGEIAGEVGGHQQIQLRILRNRDARHTSYAEVLFKRYAGQKVVGEITPDYAQLTAQDFRQMAALNADTRFIFLMRDPIDRLHSAMRKRLRGRVGGDRKRAVSGAEILAELKRVLQQKSRAALLRSQYETTIKALESAIDTDKIGLFFYEDIFGSRNVDALCDFLSIARRAGDFESGANVGNPYSEAGVDAFEALAMTQLKPTYDFMEARFGDRLPERWRQRLSA